MTPATRPAPSDANGALRALGGLIAALRVTLQPIPYGEAK